MTLPKKHDAKVGGGKDGEANGRQTNAILHYAQWKIHCGTSKRKEPKGQFCPMLEEALRQIPCCEVVTRAYLSHTVKYRLEMPCVSQSFVPRDA